jgi:hypothetical protein
MVQVEQGDPAGRHGGYREKEQGHDRDAYDPAQRPAFRRIRRAACTVSGHMVWGRIVWGRMTWGRMVPGRGVRRRGVWGRGVWGRGVWGRAVWRSAHRPSGDEKPSARMARSSSRSFPFSWRTRSMTWSSS